MIIFFKACRVAVLAVLAVILSVSLGSTVWAGELQALLTRVEKKADTIKSFTCEFRQTRNLAMFSQPVTFKGRLAMQRPDKLRWQFVSPMPSTLILNGSKGMKCSANGPVRNFDLNTDPVMGMVIRQLWGWMDGRYLAMRDLYDMKLAGGETLVLFPRQEMISRAIKQIRVSFDPATLQPARVQIMEAGGDNTLIVFHDYKFGVALADGLFSACKASD